MADDPKALKTEPPKELEQRAQTQKVQGRAKRSPQDQAEYFYAYPLMHALFFFASVGMLIGFVMMFAKDHARPWKPYQEEFAKVEFEQLWFNIRKAQEKFAENREKVAELDRQIEELLGLFRAAGKGGLELDVTLFGAALPVVPGLDAAPFKGKLHAKVDEDKKKILVVERETVRGELYHKTQLFNFAKDELGAVRYRFEEAKHHYEDAVKTGSPRVGFYEGHYEHAKKDWDRVNAHVAERKKDIDEVQKRSDFYGEFAEMLEKRPIPRLWDKPGRLPLEDLKQEKSRLVKQVEDLELRLGQEKPSLPNVVRNLPGADFFAPSLKVKQVVLSEVKDQLNFVKVEKVDRCMTCHVGIDKPGYAVWTNPEAEEEEQRYVFKSEFLQNYIAHARGKADPKTCVVCDAKGRAEGEIKQPVTAHGSWSGDEVVKFTKTFMAHPRLDLFVSDSSRHPLSKLGCTVCHEGDGRDTDFTRVVHTPDSHKEGQNWRRRHGTPYGDERYDWNYRELWDLPMLPSKFVQASCRRCHSDATELDGGEKYIQGMKLVERAGCYGCHSIDSHLILPKDHENKDIEQNRKNRRPGPPLERIATKVTPDWAAKWILEPRSFRPTTKMPHFFQLSNARHEVNKVSYPPADVNGVRRSPVDDTIVAAISKYIFQLSDTKADPAPPANLKGDVKRGELLVKQVGCTACHKVDETPLEVYTAKDSKRSRFLEDFAPALAGVGSKMNRPWLYHWVRDPKKHFKDSAMPNLRLSEQEAADVVEYLMTLRKPDWEKHPAPQADPRVVDDLLREILKKGLSDADAELAVKGQSARRGLDELKSAEGKIQYLGRFMVKNYGCYSCHQLRDDEKTGMKWTREEGIGVALTGSQPFGSKHHDRLDFGFTAFDGFNHKGVSFKHGFKGVEVEHGSDRTKNVQVAETRHEWLEAKLRNPRVFDGGKMASKPWDELLRMPWFDFNDHEIELISTFVLSFTDHKQAGLLEGGQKRLTEDDKARARGERIVRENNCKSCHRFELDRFEVKLTPPVDGKEFETVEGALVKSWNDEEALPFLQKWGLLDAKATPADVKKRGMWVRSYNWAVNHRTLAHSGAVNLGNKAVAFDGKEVWYLDMDAKGGAVARVVRRHLPQEGGEINPAVKKLKKALNESADEEFLDPANEVEFESRYAPMLRGQGVKTQSDWLYRFLKEPFAIRPTLAPIVPGGKALPDVNLRMPSFQFTDEEATALVKYFAARDHLKGVDVYPHTEFPERNPAYLAGRKTEMDWASTTLRDAEKGCAACHYVGGKVPPGPPIKHAPELSKVQDRIRPRWYYDWIRIPGEIYPGTAMAPLWQGKPEEIENVRRVSEYLMNYGSLNIPSAKVGKVEDKK